MSAGMLAGVATGRCDPLPDSAPAPQPALTGDWGGVRTSLADQGIGLGGGWIIEGFDDAAGGAARGVVGASTLDASAMLDLQKLAGLGGMEIYLDLEDHAGRGPDSLVGDIEGIDKHNWPAYLQVFEAWIQQKLLDGTLRIKIGKIDANTEFSVNGDGLDFLSTATQVTPTLLGFGTAPDSMPGVDAVWMPTPRGYAALSVTDANRADRFLDFSGHPQFNEPTRNGLLLIGEAGLSWKHPAGWGADGTLRLGVWEHTGQFARMAGGVQRDAQGGYAMLDQTLWRPGGTDGARGLRGFVAFARTDGRVAPIMQQAGGGLEWTGPLAARPADAVGVTVQDERLSDTTAQPRPDEELVEGFYKVQATDWGIVQPDVEYVAHPGGRYRDAWVGIVSMQATF
jgi:porin